MCALPLFPIHAKTLEEAKAICGELTGPGHVFLSGTVTSVETGGTHPIVIGKDKDGKDKIEDYRLLVFTLEKTELGPDPVKAYALNALDASPISLEKGKRYGMCMAERKPETIQGASISVHAGTFSLLGD